MGSTEFAAIAFAACNSARVLAYLPQIIRLARDHDGAKGLSWLTWAGFAVSNLSTVAYAVVVLSDWNMASIFGVNAAFCLAIVILVVCKRRPRNERDLSKATESILSAMRKPV